MIDWLMFMMVYVLGAAPIFVLGVRLGAKWALDGATAALTRPDRRSGYRAARHVDPKTVRPPDSPTGVR